MLCKNCWLHFKVQEPFYAFHGLNQNFLNSQDCSGFDYTRRITGLTWDLLIMWKSRAKVSPRFLTVLVSVVSMEWESTNQMVAYSWCLPNQNGSVLCQSKLSHMLLCLTNPCQLWILLYPSSRYSGYCRPVRSHPPTMVFSKQHLKKWTLKCFSWKRLCMPFTIFLDWASTSGLFCLISDSPIITASLEKHSARIIHIHYHLPLDLGLQSITCARSLPYLFL